MQVGRTGGGERAFRHGRAPTAGGLPVLLLLLGASVGAPTGHAAATPAGVRAHAEAYAGRHRGHPRFQALFDDLPGRVERALTVVHERLAIAPREGDRIDVDLQDAEPARTGLDRARCHTRCEGGDEVQVVSVHVEYFLSGDSDLDTVLVHELTHAVMRARLGRRAYERLPSWIREGLAIHAAGEGERHLRRTLLACQDVDALLTGLMGRTRRLAMYPYAWLAVDLLRAEGGPEAPARLVALLEEGLAPRVAVARIHGGSWSAFERCVRRHARARIEAVGGGIDAIRAARALYAARRHDEARAAFDDFLARFPDSAFAPTARYHRARCWFRLGEFARAEEAFGECLARDLGVSGWSDECHLFRGIARHEQGSDEGALEDLRAYLELHAYADQRDLGHLALGRVLQRLGRAGEARAAFRSVAALPGARAAHRHAAARELAALEG